MSDNNQIRINIEADIIVGNALDKAIKYLIFKSKQPNEDENLNKVGGENKYLKALKHLDITSELERRGSVVSRDSNFEEEELSCKRSTKKQAVKFNDDKEVKVYHEGPKTPRPLTGVYKTFDFTKYKGEDEEQFENTRL